MNFELSGNCLDEYNCEKTYQNFGVSTWNQNYSECNFSLLKIITKGSQNVIKEHNLKSKLTFHYADSIPIDYQYNNF